MANMAGIVTQIRQAILGKDVRKSIADGIETINNDVETLVKAKGFLRGTIMYGRAGGEYEALRVDETTSEFILPEGVNILIVANGVYKFYGGTSKRIPLRAGTTSHYLFYNTSTDSFNVYNAAEFTSMNKTDTDIFIGYYNTTTKISSFNTGKQRELLKGKLIGRANKVNINADWTIGKITFLNSITKQIMIDTAGNYYHLPTGNIEVSFNTSANSYLMFNFDTLTFFTIPYTEYNTRLPYSRECVIGLIDVTYKMLHFDVDNGYITGKGRIYNANQHSKDIIPYVDTVNNRWVIPAGYYYVFADHDFITVTFSSDVYVPFYSNNGVVDNNQYLFYNAVTNTFISDTYTKYRRRNAVIKEWYLGYYNALTKLMLINDILLDQNKINISILGDSISTYEGYIPSGNLAYYNDNNLGSVNYTWWYPLVNGKFRLCVNNSWSGRYLTTNDPNTSRCAVNAFNKLHTSSTSPDVILIYLGTNDFNNNVQLGHFTGTIDENDTTTFANTYARMLRDIYTNYPNARVYAMTLGFINKGNRGLTNGNGVRIHDYNEEIRNVCSFFNTKVIDIYNLGFNLENATTHVLNGSHPNAYGLKGIKNRVQKELEELI